MSQSDRYMRSSLTEPEERHSDNTPLTFHGTSLSLSSVISANLMLMTFLLKLARAIGDIT